MAIHELTTNAAKYGALSVFGGKVEVTWSVTIEATRRTLDFDWVESGGPPVAEPTRKGFGSRLLEFVLPGQIQAKTSIDLRGATACACIARCRCRPNQLRRRPARGLVIDDRSPGGAIVLARWLMT